VALVGRYGAGKTTLLEAILHAAGATTRKGSITAKNTVGDSSAEARARALSTEPNVATVDYLGDRFAFIDCPGSIEFFADTLAVLPAIDAAVVVTEDEPGKAQMLQPYLKHLQDRGIPHWIFVNKIDKAQARVRDLIEALSPMSAKPLLLRQLPIWNAGIVTGYIDLALERAHVYREHAPSEIVAIPATEAEREKEARYRMLERLADYDDHLMEELLSDIEPPRDQVFNDLTREMREGLIVPVCIGSAERGNGVLRLLKVLRHDGAAIAETAARLGVGTSGPIFQVAKVMHTSHGGRLVLGRVFAGTLTDGANLQRGDGSLERVSGISRIASGRTDKLDKAQIGDVVALGKVEKAQAGETLGPERGSVRQLAPLMRPEPVTAVAVFPKERKDETKLAATLARIAEEDPGLTFAHRPETHELLVHGQGEVHLKVTVERLARNGVGLVSVEPKVAYRETIKRGATQRGRHKKQTGGHGQFGDVVLDIKPLSRGEGIVFEETITGGVVPRNYIPAVEEGVRHALEKGPLGFPVTDVSVTLTDGSYHPVDSSDQAFQMAGALGIREALPNCQPVLLEPILSVAITVPNDATSRVSGIVSGRRGQILGFAPSEALEGWDVVTAEIPEAEMRNLIVDLRSATAGVGTYRARFDHMAELTGRLADKVVEAHKPKAA